VSTAIGQFPNWCEWRDFGISTIQIIAQIPQVVFDNSRMAKMHDSLLFHVFSKQPIILKLQEGNVLYLVAVAKRRTSVGVDCDPWGQSAPFFFSLEFMDIAARVFELADLPIDIIYQSIDNVGMYGYLLEIAGRLYEGISPTKPYCPIAGDHKQCVKSFFLSQVFLGAFNPSA
jgi:hypothetical protein